MNKGQNEGDSTEDIVKYNNATETGAPIIQAYLKNLPGKPGVYRMLGADGKVLYVGKAKSLKNASPHTRTRYVKPCVSDE